MEINTFCSYCGNKFSNKNYPRFCKYCKTETYLSAPAVGIGLVPINNGILVVRRNILPGIGQLALPGGYKNVDETWEEGIAREVFEETGITVDSETITLFDVKTTERGAVLVFGLCARLFLDEPIQFRLDHETQEAFVVEQPVAMCFSHHEELTTRWFNSHNSSGKIPKC